MASGLELSLAPRLEAQASPALVAFAHVLGLSGADLEQEIERELLDNPALERLDPQWCAMCGDPLSHGRCRACSDPRRRDGELAAIAPLGAEEPSTGSELLAEARLLLPDAEHALADYVVGTLDEHGFLSENVTAIAEGVGSTPGRVGSCASRLPRPGMPRVRSGTPRPGSSCAGPSPRRLGATRRASCVARCR